MFEVLEEQVTILDIAYAGREFDTDDFLH